jgi:hypothetical protein
MLTLGSEKFRDQIPLPAGVVRVRGFKNKNEPCHASNAG